MKRIAVLYSSGIESASSVVYYLEKGFLVYPVYVRSGFAWERIEREKALRLWSYFRKGYKRILPVRTVFIKGLGPRKGSIEIPLRNMILTTLTALEALRRRIRSVAVGSLGIYPFPDNSREYFDRLEELIRIGSRTGFRIETPFMGMEKWEVIKRFNSKLKFELTFSCIRPIKGMHCGICEKCLERKEGFRLAGVKDPTPYYS